MKFLFIILFSQQVNAENYTFKYKTHDELKITVPGNDYFTARTKAAKMCFEILTKNIYPGDDAGLNYIDICVNPLK